MACRRFRSVPPAPPPDAPYSPVDPFPPQVKVEARIQHVGSARLVHNAASVLTNIEPGGPGVDVASAFPNMSPKYGLFQRL